MLPTVEEIKQRAIDLSITIAPDDWGIHTQDGIWQLDNQAKYCCPMGCLLINTPVSDPNKIPEEAVAELYNISEAYVQGYIVGIDNYRAIEHPGASEQDDIWQEDFDLGYARGQEDGIVLRL